MRGTALESRTSILIVLEKEQLTKVDKVAGSGNRSSYIRWLIDTIDEANLKREIELEQTNRVLQKLPMQLEKRIVARDIKIAELKNRIHLLKAGKPEEKEVAGLEQAHIQYGIWRRERIGFNYSGTITTATKKWCEFRAKKMDMDVNELALMLEQEYQRKRSADWRDRGI